jgi:amino acid transporter
MHISNILLGRPLATHEQDQTRIGVATAVPAMGLDALTSSAYGPEAALTILLPLGSAGIVYLQPLTGLILLLLAMLYFSYRQTILAYPVNGGSYTVAKENLGTWAGLVAAAALMLDYILNVAVGISAGVAALVSAVPALHPYILPLCLAILAIISLLNLRGTGEAGLVFGVPTYFLIGSLGTVLILGVARALASGGHPQPVIAAPQLPAATEQVGLWILLRAFASGCTAMTGVEAVSNGVSAFAPPTVDRARRTLTIIVLILAFFLGCIAYTASAYHVGAMPQEVLGYQSVLSQLTAAVVGRSWFYYLTIGSVLATLCLSANTSFVDFPRLSRMIAQDDFLPRAFAIVGRRLVYSVGVGVLCGSAALLLIVFGGMTDRLIPLFAVGAFLAFTLSQAGMVNHWRKELGRASPGQQSSSRFQIQLRLWINALGAFGTAVALIIILLAKFAEGAWITALAIPLVLLLFWSIHHYYHKLKTQISVHRPIDLDDNPRPLVVVPMKQWDRPTEKALRFALWLSTDVIAIHLSNLTGEEAAEDDRNIRETWRRNIEFPARGHGSPTPRLLLAKTPYRRFLNPLLTEIDRLKNEYPNRLIAIVVPEIIETHWWEFLLHRRKAAKLRAALLHRNDHRVIVVDVPWYIED